MKKLLTVLIAVAITMSCTACSNNVELETLRKENESLRNQLSNQSSSASPIPDTSVSYRARFKDEGTETVLNTNTVNIKMLNDIIITKDTEGDYDIILNFEFTNKEKEGGNFNSKASLSLYQNGIELDSLLGHNGYIEDANIYDSTLSFTKIKDSATIKVQKAYKLSDLSSNIDVELAVIGTATVFKTIEIYK